jgi:hypothetical protein
MQRPEHAAFTSLTIQPAGDLLPVRVDLDDRAQTRAGLIRSGDAFQVHLREPPYGKLATVEATSEVG